MSKVVIYGLSDDLIEVEGDIEEEFNPAYGSSTSRLCFSDGTILSIVYGGMWKIELLNAGTAVYEKIYEAVEDDTRVKVMGKYPDYSDVVTLNGDVKFVTFGRIK